MTRKEAIKTLKKVCEYVACDAFADKKLYGKVIDVIDWLERPLGERLVEVLKEVREK